MNTLKKNIYGNQPSTSSMNEYDEHKDLGFIPESSPSPDSTSSMNEYDEHKDLGFIPDANQPTSAASSPSPDSTLSPAQDRAPAPVNNLSNVTNSQYGEDFGEKSNTSALMPFVNEAVAGAAGALPDLVGLGVNAAKYVGSKFTNSDPNYVNSVTEKISNYLNSSIPENQRLGNVSKHMTRFISSLFGVGYAGKAIEGVGKAAQAIKGLSGTGKAVEKTGSVLSKHLGMTEPSLKNIGAAGAAGATAGLSENIGLPTYLEIPAVLFAFMFGGGAGNKVSKILKPLSEKVPGLENFLKNQNYENIAKQINPDYMKDLFKSAILDGDEGLKNQVYSKLPKELRKKVVEAPETLTDSEMNSVIGISAEDYMNYISSIEKKMGISLTTGEYTSSPKILATEDYFANNPNIDSIDNFTKNRRFKIYQELEKLKKSISNRDVDSMSLGENVYKDVKKIQKDAEEVRRKNWSKNFGHQIDEEIIPIPNFLDKLEEYAKLNGDSEGERISKKLANDQLKRLKVKVEKAEPEEFNQNKSLDTKDFKNSLESGELKTKTNEEVLVSPKRINTILAGLYEDLSRLPHKTFSKFQVKNLKESLDRDLDIAAAENKYALKVRIARDAYRKDSEFIEKINESILFNKINKDSLNVPERVAKSIENMDFSQLKYTIEILQRLNENSHVLPDLQKYYLDKALKESIKNGVENFSVKTFFKKLPEKKVLDLIFGDSHVYDKFKDISLLLKRIARYEPQRKGSHTAQRLQVESNMVENKLEDLAFNAGINVAKGKFAGAFSLIGEALGKKTSSEKEKAIVEILLSPEKRQQILENKDILKSLNNFNEIKKPESSKGNIKSVLVPQQINKNDQENKKKKDIKFDVSKIPKVGRMFSKIKELEMSK